jgi:hypothetical protein
MQAHQVSDTTGIPGRDYSFPDAPNSFFLGEIAQGSI